MNNLPIIGIAVEEMAELNAEGRKTPIPVDEYEHRPEFIPSRGVYLTVKGEVIKAGVVAEVPKRQSTGGTERKKTTKGGTPQRPYTNRNESIFCEWDENKRFLMLNRSHPFVKRYYMQPDSVGTKTTKWLEEVYY